MSYLKTLFIFSIISFHSLAQAEILRFKVFESSVGEYQPFEVIVETKGNLESIKRITIKDKVKNIAFFNLKNNELDIKQTGTEISIREKAENLFPLNKVTYDNYWGDAPIDPQHTYSIEIKLVVKNNKVFGGNIEISDNQFQEMALWGDLVLPTDIH